MPSLIPALGPAFRVAPTLFAPEGIGIGTIGLGVLAAPVESV